MSRARPRGDDDVCIVGEISINSKRGKKAGVAKSRFRFSHCRRIGPGRVGCQRSELDARRVAAVRRSSPPLTAGRKGGPRRSRSPPVHPDDVAGAGPRPTMSAPEIEGRLRRHLPGGGRRKFRPLFLCPGLPHGKPGHRLSRGRLSGGSFPECREWKKSAVTIRTKETRKGRKIKNWYPN